MRKILIVGAGEEGHCVREILHERGEEVVGFLDDEKTGKEIVGTTEEVGDWSGYPLIIAIGDNHIRARLFNQIRLMGRLFTSAIHPQSIISPTVKHNLNLIVHAGAIINPFTKIGNNVIINTAAILEHNCVIEDHTHIAPGAILLGGVHVKKYVLVGAGAIVGEDLTVGENSVVGAGSVVTRDVPDNVTVIGIPAKILK
jgi:sugar O-acyltransferase (sialic acid O-acetyltransferase NeuD family)